MFWTIVAAILFVSVLPYVIIAIIAVFYYLVQFIGWFFGAIMGALAPTPKEEKT